ncbi:FtsX-like permease family protein [Streptomyces sp. NPDC004250]|uniref:FtsX-like permease family protein n=1 Tax=Streptomyces sp. NPDC004250 TaxID=3364692 RepID=UPI0036B673CE
MLRLAVEMAKDRITTLLAVICAVLGAAALVTATGVLAESGLRSHLPPGRLGGADIVVSADQTVHPAGDVPMALPERGTVAASVAGKLAGMPGVTAAVADIGFPAGVIDAHGEAVTAADPRTGGHGWSSLRLLPHPKFEGREPAGSAEVAVDSAIAASAGVRPGESVRVVAAGRSSTYHVAAVVDAPGAGILFPDRTAVHLAGRDSGPRAGTADLIGLRTTPGVLDKVAADVRDALDDTGLVVGTGGERGDLVSPDAAAAGSLLVLLASSLAGIILLVTGFVIAGALGVSIAGQRRALALMRAVGATPKQIRRLVAHQATVVVAVALAPGVGLGYLLAAAFRSQLAGRGLLPQTLPLTISPLPAAVTVVLLVLTVQVSARGAARRTSQLPATEAVAESRSAFSTPSRLRTRAGLLLIVAATALSVIPLLSRTALSASTTSLAGIIGAIGLAMAGPVLIRWAGEMLARRLRPGVSAATWLAVSNVRGYALRIAGIVSALAMMVAFLLTYTFAQTTLQAATSQDVRTGTLAQHRLSAPGLGGLPQDTLDAIRDTAGVKAAAPVSSTTVIWSYEELGEPTAESAAAMILTPQATSVLDLGVTSGKLGDLKGKTVAIDSDLARTRGFGVGDRVSLILGDGTSVSPRVAALYTRGLGFGPVVLSHDLVRNHITGGLDQSILVRTDGTAATDEGLAALTASHPGLVLEPAIAEISDSLSDAPPEVWINLATITILLGYLLLSIANKIVAATAQRRNEIATLRLTGTTPRQILGMMRREAMLIAAAALTAGLALSAIPLALLGTGFLDRPWPAGPAWLLPAVAVTVVSVAFFSTELPTRRTLRTSPAHALAERG